MVFFAPTGGVLNDEIVDSKKANACPIAGSASVCHPCPSIYPGLTTGRYNAPTHHLQRVLLTHRSVSDRLVSKVDVSSLPECRPSAMNCHDTMSYYEGWPHCWKSGIAVSAEQGQDQSWIILPEDHCSILEKRFAAFSVPCCRIMHGCPPEIGSIITYHNAQESSIFWSEYRMAKNCQDFGCLNPMGTSYSYMVASLDNVS